MLLTALKDQHEPQDPWSLIGVTAPCLRQSTKSGIFTFAGLIKVAPPVSNRRLSPPLCIRLNPFIVWVNS
jgi:hypothetical protein